MVTTPMGWKNKKSNNPHKGLTKYQRVIVWSVILAFVYQIAGTVFFFFFNNDIIWKSALIFSGGISFGGYILTMKVGWSIEDYEKKYKQAVYEQYGIDLDNPKKRNIMSFLNDNENVIVESLDKVDSDKLESWLGDTVKNINKYEPMPEPAEKWMEDFE